MELGSVFGILARASELECPNLKRLSILSPPHREPRLLLEVLGQLLAARKEAGVPFQSVTVKDKSEKLFPLHLSDLLGGPRRRRRREVGVRKDRGLGRRRKY